MPKPTFRPNLTFQMDEAVREDGRILINSGKTTRNRDWWTGKPYRLVPDGMRLKYFYKNPLVLWMHDFNIPLAKSNDTYIRDGMLWATDDLEFHRRTIPIVAMSGGLFGGGAAVGEFDTSVVADMWQEGFYNAVSVHVMFRPEDEENIIEEEDEIVAGTSEVLEWSIVTMPGDPESGREEMVDRMVHKGMRRDVAEAIASGPGTFAVSGSALYVPSHMLKTANSGSSVSVPVQKKRKVVMSKSTPAEEVETTAAEAAEEVADVTVELEVQDELVIEEEIEQVIEIPAVELASALAEDEEAMHIMAMALINHSGFGQALAEAYGQSVPPAAELLSAPALPVAIKFVSSGRSQVSQPAQAARPAVKSAYRPTVAQAAPVALPNAKPKKKSPFLTMYRKNKS